MNIKSVLNILPGRVRRGVHAALYDLGAVLYHLLVDLVYEYIIVARIRFLQIVVRHAIGESAFRSSRQLSCSRYTYFEYR